MRNINSRLFPLSLRIVAFFGGLFLVIAALRMLYP